MRKSEEKVKRILQKLGWKIKEIDKKTWKMPYPDFIIYNKRKRKIIEVKTIQTHTVDRVVFYHRKFNFMIATVKYGGYYIIPISKIKINRTSLHLRKYEKYKNKFNLLGVT